MRPDAEISLPGGIAALAATAVFLAFTAVLSKTGGPLLVFLFSFLTWSSYLVSHKLLEGKFVDGKPVAENDKKTPGMRPRKTVEAAGIAFGGALFISGMVIGAKGVNAVSFLITAGGAFLFIAGYVIAHFSATGDLL